MDEFKKEKGRLMKVDFDDNFGYKYAIWFDYTRNLMMDLRVGTLLAIPNFSHYKEEEHLSIVSIANVMPFHYAAGSEMLGYPTFEDQVRQEAFLDFYNQADKSVEETTKIQIIATPTGLELNKQTGQLKFRSGEETQIPMYGGEVAILGNDLITQIFNGNLLDNECIEIGKLTRGNIEIKAKVEDLIRTHIGIFGYTGMGKSNLSSTLIAKILKEYDRPVKIVVFDLMGEYFALLADILLETDGCLGFLEVASLTKEVKSFMEGKGDKDKAAISIVGSLQIPSSLNSPEMKKKYIEIVKKLLSKGKIKVRYETFKKLGDFIFKVESNARDSGELQTLNSEIWEKFSNEEFNEDNIRKLEVFLKGKNLTTLGAGVRKRDLLNALEKLDESFEPIKEHKLEVYSGSKSLVNDLLHNNKSGLYIIESESVDEIRTFSKEIICGGYSIYNERRKNGYDHTSNPLILFYFDEADEFIPQEPQGSYKDSSIAVETIARRGRKFGLGVCIATQRVTYLNTNIMAQPHTYFISKLPRKSDRERVIEAFGISDEMLRETFKFRKGDWLLISHDATGMKSVPIPIHTDNAEDRIRKNLE